MANTAKWNRAPKDWVLTSYIFRKMGKICPMFRPSFPYSLFQVINFICFFLSKIWNFHKTVGMRCVFQHLMIENTPKNHVLRKMVSMLEILFNHFYRDSIVDCNIHMCNTCIHTKTRASSGRLQIWSIKGVIFDRLYV